MQTRKLDDDRHDDKSSTQHGSVIESLARETGTEPARVKQMYEHELAHLEANSKVRGFLSVLASRNVRAALLRTDATPN